MGLLLAEDRGTSFTLLHLQLRDSRSNWVKFGRTGADDSLSSSLCNSSIIHINIHAYMRAYICIDIHSYTYIHTYVHTYIHTYICISIHVLRYVQSPQASYLCPYSHD